MAKEYIGDSVYCECKNGEVILITENGRIDDPSNKIILGPVEWQNLINFVRDNIDE